MVASGAGLSSIMPGVPPALARVFRRARHVQAVLPPMVGVSSQDLAGALGLRLLWEAPEWCSCSFPPLRWLLLRLAA